jgi:hypothetical protein
VEIAEKRGSQAVEPMHMLLSLSQEDGALASDALRNCGVDTARLEGIMAGGK